MNKIQNKTKKSPPQITLIHSCLNQLFFINACDKSKKKIIFKSIWTILFLKIQFFFHGDSYGGSLKTVIYIYAAVLNN